MAHMLKLVTFDVTGTLMMMRPPVPVKYAEAAKAFGISVNNDDVLHNFKNQWKILSKEHPNFGRSSGLGWRNWWTQIVVNTLKSSAQTFEEEKLQEVAAYLIEEYQTTRCWALADGALNILSYLKNSNVTLGVISNYDERLESTLTALSIQPYFNFILSSYSVGVMKPHRKIFDTARNLVPGNISPEHCLHIGNSIEFDYFGARNAGWRSIYVGDLSSDVLSKALPSDVFKNLTELKEYFEYVLIR